MKNLVLALLMLVTVGIEFCPAPPPETTPEQVAAAKLAMITKKIDLLAALNDYYTAYNAALSEAEDAEDDIDAMIANNPGWDGTSFQLAAVQARLDIQFEYDMLNSSLTTPGATVAANSHSVNIVSLILTMSYDSLQPDKSWLDSVTNYEFGIIYGQDPVYAFQRTGVVTNCEECIYKMDLRQGWLIDGECWMYDKQSQVADNLAAAQASLNAYLNP